MREQRKKGATLITVRSLATYLADQNRRAADDRDLTSRGDLKKVRKESEEAFTSLARELCDCSDKQLKQLELPELLRNCVLDARKIDSPSAKYRALRLVRRELRNGDTEAIRRQLEALSNPRRKPAATSAIEQWRERLISGSEAALEEFLSEYPNAERQQLRQLVRNAQKADEARRSKAIAALSKCLTLLTRNQPA